MLWASGVAAKPKVLIETYWNVNSADAAAAWRGERVLIETYWNVNI